MLCGFCKIHDFICFLTFFITAVVSLLFIQYFLVFLDSDPDDNTSPLYLILSFYFFWLTLFGCLVFAGIQMRSVRLLKWPGRLLVGMMIFGLTATTSFLWIYDRVYDKSIANLEGKSFNLAIMVVLVVFYFIGICKFIKKIESPPVIINMQINSDQLQERSLIINNNNVPPSRNQTYETPSTSNFPHAHQHHLNNNNNASSIPLMAMNSKKSFFNKTFHVVAKESPNTVTNYYAYYGVGTGTLSEV